MGIIKSTVKTVRDLNKMRRFLRKNSVDLSQIKSISDWAKRDYLPPSPTALKQTVLLRLVTDGQHIIETGTYKGESSRLFHSAGHPVTTIEVHKPLYDSVSPSLINLGIDCYLGDSGYVFAELLPKFKSRSVFFWLDGHYSAGITGMGGSETPISQELNHIESILLPTDQHITIAIDDFRCFPDSNQNSDYPSRTYLVDWAEKNGFRWDVENDIFVATNRLS